jgi:hypothetical protein
MVLEQPVRSGDKGIWIAAYHNIGKMLPHQSKRRKIYVPKL